MNGFLDDLPDLDIGDKEKKPIPPPPEPANILVEYIKVKCPAPGCNSKDTKVYDSNHLPIRYHICNKCGFRFKSVEKKD